MDIKKIDFNIEDIPQDAVVTVRTMGNTTEICYNSKRNTRANTLKLSADEYLVLNTGEVKLYEKDKAVTRQQSPGSLRKTFRKIQQLVLTNVIDIKKVRWVTLTYAENMTDTEQLYEDYRKHNQRFRYYCRKMGYGEAKYIAVAEPQGRGAWHLHVFYIWEDTAPYIPNSDLAKIWGHGFVSIKALKDTDNIAGYLTAYLANMEIDANVKEYFEEKQISEIEIDGERKYFVKGARLHMYPSNFNILRHSEGIKKPEEEHIRMKRALKKVNGMRQTYQSSHLLSDGKGFNNIIVKTEYRK